MEDEDDHIYVMVMMMMITLHDPLECIKCEYSSIVNRLQAQSDIQLPRPIARSQFLERASLCSSVFSPHLCSVHKCVLLNMLYILYILCKGAKQSPTRWNHHH